MNRFWRPFNHRSGGSYRKWLLTVLFFLCLVISWRQMVVSINFHPPPPPPPPLPLSISIHYKRIWRICWVKSCITDSSGCIFQIGANTTVQKGGFLSWSSWLISFGWRVQGYLFVRFQNVRVKFDCFIPVDELVCYRFTGILNSASQG